MLNLLPVHKVALAWLVGQIREQVVPMEFMVQAVSDECLVYRTGKPIDPAGGYLARVEQGRYVPWPCGTMGTINALVRADCLQEVALNIPAEFSTKKYAITDVAFRLIDSNFAEEPKPSPRQEIHYWQPTISSSTGIQIGNHNQMTVQMAAETIAQSINNSAASPEQKEEVKGSWKKFWENPLTKAVLEAGTTVAVKEIKG